MTRFANGIVRLSLAAWFGAALLFVLVAIRPIRAPQLETPARAFLAGLLFPGYYWFGLVLLSVSLLAASLSNLKRKQVILLATAASAILGLIDWIFIYSPLAEMTRLQWVEQSASPASFRTYHLASMGINGVVLLCSAIAAVVACFSEPKLMNNPQ